MASGPWARRPLGICWPGARALSCKIVSCSDLSRVHDDDDDDDDDEDDQVSTQKLSSFR
jgi:hypothetical protein